MSPDPRHGVSGQSAVLVRGLPSADKLSRPRFVALGSFDGLHLGHRALLKTVKQHAREGGAGAALVVSFHPHPAIVLGRETVRPPLLSLRQRLQILGELGFEALVLLRFSHALSQLSAADFVADILVRQLDVHTLFVGPDAALGRGREAGVVELERLLAQHGRKLVVVPPVEENGEKLGSRSIRNAISRGELGDVQRVLADGWRIEGRVVHGDGRGKTISIPTANIATRQLLPAAGVYSGLAWIDDVSYPAVANIGRRPTFNGSDLTVEAHLYSWHSGDFYGRRVLLELHQKLRDEHRFESVDALVSQIRKDIERAGELLAARNLQKVL